MEVVAVPTWFLATILPLVVAGVSSLAWIAYQVGTFAREMRSHEERLKSHSKHLDAADSLLGNHGERIVRLETHTRVVR